MKKITLKIKYILAIWSLAIIAIYPVVFLYGQNFREVSLQEAVKPAITLLKLYIIIFVIALFILKDLGKTILYTLIVILLGNYFKLIESLLELVFPVTKYWHLLSILLIACVALISVFKRKVSFEFVNVGLSLLIIAANFYFFVNTIPVAINKITVEPLNVSNLSNQLDEGKERYPNIYYLLFDEYSSNQFMKKYYDFDNSFLVDKLDQLGFNVSLSSSNEAYMTRICMTNTFNMDYLFDMDDDTDREKDDLIEYKRKNNLFFDILKEKGYLIQAIGHADFYGLEDASNAQEIENATIDGKTFKELILQKTVLYPFVKENTLLKVQSIKKSKDYINSLELLPNNNNFILFHIELPHTAFVVDKDGNPINAENRLNWNDKKYYLGQYQYTSDMMLDIATKIIEKDPESVIILSSDHSARGRAEFEDSDKCQIFNAVYFRGQKLNIEGLSGINTLRTVVNQIFGMEYDMLKVKPLEPAKEKAV